MVVALVVVLVLVMRPVPDDVEGRLQPVLPCDAHANVERVDFRQRVGNFADVCDDAECCFGGGSS